MFNEDANKIELANALLLIGDKARAEAHKRMSEDAFKSLVIENRDRINRLHGRCAVRAKREGRSWRGASIARFERFWLTAFRRAPGLTAV
jgi:hypothetical protein